MIQITLCIYVFVYSIDLMFTVCVVGDDQQVFLAHVKMNHGFLDVKYDLD